MKEMDKLESGQESLFQVSEDGMVVLGKKIYLPDNEVLKGDILREAY